MGLIIGTGGSGGGGAITMYAIIAWDGASTPVPANIPAGVQVTHNGTTYTGTLAAAKGTLNKVRLVYHSTNSNYKQYLTVKSGSAYSWAYVGSTNINVFDDEQTVAEHIALLEEKVSALENTLASGKLGDIDVDTVIVRDGVTRYGSDGNEYLSGTGAPTMVPDHAGQKYYDKTSGARHIYEAIDNTAVSDWLMTV